MKKAVRAKKSVLKLKCVKMSAEDIALITENARRWERGNFSSWLRRAGKEYIPKRGGGSGDDFY